MLIMLNVRNRDCAVLYDNEKAFYDLNRQRHGRYLELLEKGTTCCVLSYEYKRNIKGNVKLECWKYRDFAECPDEDAWYMLGTKLKTKTGLQPRHNCDADEPAFYPPSPKKGKEL